MSSLAIFVFGMQLRGYLKDRNLGNAGLWAGMSNKWLNKRRELKLRRRAQSK